MLELFTGINSGCQVTVGMPPEQTEAMQAAMLEDECLMLPSTSESFSKASAAILGTGLQKLWDVLGSIRFANASVGDASKHFPQLLEDRSRIPHFVEQSVGCVALDARISVFLRDWMLVTCEAYLSDILQTGEPDEATARACVSIGVLLRESGKLGRAVQVYKYGKEIRLATSTLETRSGAELLMCIGNVKAELGDLNGALEEYLDAKRVRIATGTLETPDGGTLLMCIGTTKGNLGNLKGDLDI